MIGMIWYDALMSLSLFWQNFTSSQADKSYTASVVLDGAELSYFGQEGMQEVLVGESKVKCTSWCVDPKGQNVLTLKGSKILPISVHLCRHLYCIASITIAAAINTIAICIAITIFGLLWFALPFLSASSLLHCHFIMTISQTRHPLVKLNWPTQPFN